MDAVERRDALEPLDALDAVESSGDEGVESDDETRHKTLLKSLGVEEKKESDRKSSKDQRSEATHDVSVYSLGGSNGQRSKLSTNDLLRGMQESVNVNILKKNLARVENSQKQLKAPLPRITAEKTARDAAYTTTTTKVSRWEDIVKRNRTAEHLSFPLNHENLAINTVDDYVRRFKPKTPLEQQIYEVLKGSKYEERPDNGLSVAEEEALKSVSLEEARQRRAELQKHRALLSYYEAKQRRLGRIKSRRHLRIIRKQKEKKSAKEFEELQKNDPEGAATQIKTAEKLRAEERAALRHRQGSKWAKNRMLMAKYDEMTKVQIQEQKKLHSDLTRKKLLKNDSSDDGESGDENNNSGSTTEFIPLVPPTASQQTLYLPKDNPWLRQGPVKKNRDTTDEQGPELLDENEEELELNGGKKEKAILGLKSVTRDVSALSGGESSEGEDDEFQEELLEIRKRKEFRKQLENGGMGTKNGGGAIQAEKISCFKAAFASLKKDSKRQRQRKKTTEDGDESSEEENETIKESDEEELSVNTDRRKTLEDLEEVLQTEGDISTLNDLHRSSKKKIAKKRKETKKLEYIDPEKVFTLPTQEVSSATPTTVENEDGNTSQEEDINRMTIREAFADDDVVADFVSEKDKMVADSKPKVQDLTLPGWGEWGGIGLKPSKRRRQKFLFKSKPLPPRKDQHLGHVIINENRDVYIAKHQVNQIPFKFSSDEQFERSIRQPIGTMWTTPSTFKELTKPKVKTIPGVIIHPMQEEDAFDRDKAQRKRVVQGDGNIGFDDITDPRMPIRRKKGNKKHKK